MQNSAHELCLLGKVSRKKVAVLLDFVQMRGGEGPAQISCPLFTNCIYWVNFGMGREGETPAKFFWHIGAQISLHNFKLQNLCYILGTSELLFNVILKNGLVQNLCSKRNIAKLV